jgi:glycosyl transferase family 4
VSSVSAAGRRGREDRSLHMVRHLLAAGHAVTVCSLLRSPAEERGAAELAELGARVIAQPVREWRQWARMLLRLPTSQPITFGYFYSSALEHEIDELFARERWDLVLVYCSSMGPYVRGRSAALKIIDFIDMDSQKWLDYGRAKPFPIGVLYALEGRRLERAERRLAQDFDFCTTISRNELDTLNQLAGGTPSEWRADSDSVRNRRLESPSPL